MLLLIKLELGETTVSKEELSVLSGEEERWTVMKEELLVLSDDSCC